jgi:hypothetical protein
MAHDCADQAGSEGARDLALFLTAGLLGITSYAKERVMRRDAEGMLLPVNKWIISQNKIMSIADGRFRAGNCSLSNSRPSRAVSP